jgi:tRNA pseudouridine13 synthase
LREFWGKWLECKQQLDRSHRRSIVTYLVDHPTDFRRALALLRSDLRSLYLAAFQSHLWNQMVARWLTEHVPAADRYTKQGAAGQLTFWSCSAENLVAELAELEVPLPSARQHAWPDGFDRLLDQVLEPFQMQRHEIRVKYPRDTFFSKGQRRVLLRVEKLQGLVAADELTSGRHKVCLEFTLPRGAYATMVVKCLS